MNTLRGNPETPYTGPSRRPRYKKRLVLATALLTLLIVEVGVRVILALSVGPSVLWFGTLYERKRVSPAEMAPLPESTEVQNHTVMNHGYRADGYTKYWPGQKRVDHDPRTGEVFDVSINGHGFRGLDYEVEKDSDVVRVVTLGASSTFGYYNRDHETYPHVLENLLNQRYGGKRAYEVINLGIPHSRSSHIVALLLAEAMPLQPDVVTFYEGINDSDATNTFVVAPDRPPALSFRGIFRGLGAVYQFFRRGLVCVAVADAVVRQTGPVVETFATGEIRVSGLSQADVEEHSVGKREHFLANLDVIRDFCQQEGIVFIVVNQQAHSRLLGADERKNVTYSEELGLIEAMLGRGERITRLQATFLVHGELMNGLEQWAAESGVGFVDAIAALDGHRDQLLSWVHLSPQANQILAAQLAAKIEGSVEATGRVPGWNQPDSSALPDR